MVGKDCVCVDLRELIRPWFFDKRPQNSYKRFWKSANIWFLRVQEKAIGQVSGVGDLWCGLYSVYSTVHTV